MQEKNSHNKIITETIARLNVSEEIYYNWLLDIGKQYFHKMFGRCEPNRLFWNWWELQYVTLDRFLLLTNFNFKDSNLYYRVHQNMKFYPAAPLADSILKYVKKKEAAHG